MRRGPLPIAALLAALVALLCLAPAAFGHAQLEGTEPPVGSVLDASPAAVEFSFDEPVDGPADAVRVYDAEGQRVDRGGAYHPDGEGRRIAVDLEPDLADGTYTATYRVISADGHVISSGFVFTVGEGGPAPTQTVAELTEADSTGAVTDVAFGLARGLQYAAMALAIGGVFFGLALWLPALARVGCAGREWEGAAEAYGRRASRLLAGTALLGLLTAAAIVVLEGAETNGTGFFAALQVEVVGDSLDTRSGTGWGLAALAWVLLGALALGLPVARRAGHERVVLGLAALPAAFLACVPALSGHAGVQSPVWLLAPANALHVAAMGIWLGGLAFLLLVVPAGTRRLAAGERTRLLAAILARFSQVALLAVGVILATGLLQAYVFVREPAALLDSGYGRAVLAKLLLLLAVAALGAYNRRRVLPRLRAIAAGGQAPGAAGLVLRRVLRAEVALLVVILGVTAALASYAPPVNASAGPFSAREDLGPVLVELTVDPARVGPNEAHLYLFDSRTGAPYEGVKELTMTAEQPEEGISLPIEPEVSGPGHWTAPGAAFSSSGEWEIDVTARISAFDQYEHMFEVPIE